VFAPPPRRRFVKARLIRPDATHRESSEIYLVATGYRAAGADVEDEREAPGG
jgi:hypothetical protein